MLKVVTADTIVESVNKLPSRQFSIEKPWWFIGSENDYTNHVTGTNEWGQKWLSVFDAFEDAVSKPEDALAWLKEHWKLAVVGFVALLVLLKD